MSRLADTLAATAGHLEDMGADWALVGGLAVSARAEPRLTRDIDVAVRVDSDEQAEAVVRQLLVLGHDVAMLIEHEPTSRIATVRLAVRSSPGMVVDLLFCSCGIEPEVVAAAEDIEVFADVIVPVARAHHLIAMKVLAYDQRDRPQDHDDLLGLLEVLPAGQVDDVIDALRLITERGYHRGADLVARLQGMRAHR